MRTVEDLEKNHWPGVGVDIEHFSRLIDSLGY
jgi:hypothetical protein